MPSRRGPVSCRERRTARTTSAPSRHLATSSGMHSGGSCRSASIVITASPRAWASPAAMAAWKPQLRLSSSRAKRESRAAWARISSVERSRLPSSTSSTSHCTVRLASKTAVRRASNSGSTCSSLKIGMTTVTAGGGGGGAMVGEIETDARGQCKRPNREMKLNIRARRGAGGRSTEVVFHDGVDGAEAVAPADFFALGIGAAVIRDADLVDAAALEPGHLGGDLRLDAAALLLDLAFLPHTAA